MDTFALLALCEGNQPVSDEFPSYKGPVMQSFIVFFVDSLNMPFNKQSVASDLKYYDDHVATLYWLLCNILHVWLS